MYRKARANTRDWMNFWARQSGTAWATGTVPRNAADVNTQAMRSGAEYAPQSDGLGGAVLRRIIFMGRRSPGSGRSSESSDGGIFCS